MGLPSKKISPPLALSRPARMRRVVDFPQPDGPTSTVNSPSARSRSIGDRTRTLPKLFSIFSNRMVGNLLSFPKEADPSE